MPRPKSWISRIAVILKALEADATEQYTRQMVEQLFGLGADQAAQVMEIAGYSQRPRPGVGGLTARPALVSYVRNCSEGQAALQEMSRRQKLAAKLKAAESELSFRKVQLKVTKADEWSRFENLPNVAVRPGMMQATFTPGDPVDLLDTLFRFVKAAGNEWPALVKMCQKIEDNS
jgi:hypothetical protein